MNRVARLAGAGLVLLSVSLSPVHAEALDEQHKQALISTAPQWAALMDASSLGEIDGEKASEGTHYLYFSEQVEVRQHSHTNYRELAMGVISGDGASNAGRFTVSFQPEFETPRIHAVEIFRNGEVLQRMDSSVFQMLDREHDLQSNMYYGNKGVHVLIPDVRIGDVVHYAYSVESRNPAQGDIYSDYFSTQWASWLDRYLLRIVWERDGTPLIRSLPENSAPTPHHQGKVWSWDLADIQPHYEEKYTPRDYSQWQEIHVGTTASWPQVREQVQHYYQHGPTTAERKAGKASLYQALLADIRKQHGARAQMDEAVRYVQDEIRYLGLELGEGGILPRGPEVVLETHYGDCKDKSTLLMSLLQDLGIPAQRALVNGGYGYLLDRVTPGLFIFNHQIVRAQLGNRWYWIDPTISHQGSNTESRYQPDYGYALLLDYDQPSNEGLVRMHQIPQATMDHRISEVMDYSAGFDAPGQLTITTRYLGGDAEATRANLIENGLYELGKYYTEYMQGVYPGLTSKGKLEVNDDRGDNELVITEKYEQHDFWKKDETQKRHYLAVEHYDVASQLYDVEPGRTRPLRVPYPLIVTQRSEVIMPEPWNARLNQRVDNQWFHYESRVESENNRVFITTSLRTKTPRVEASELKNYSEELERIRKDSVTELFKEEPSRKPLQKIFRGFWGE